MKVAQGSAHVWNCFLASDDRQHARFFGWDTWRIAIGESDLAQMLTIHWYPGRRRRIERRLLDRNHEAILVHRVRDYGHIA